MTNAKRDQNNIPTLLTILESDGTTIVPVKANLSSNNSLQVDDNTTGSDLGPDYALRDDNFIPVLMAVSSVDGSTPVPIYGTADGKILIDSN